MGAIDLNSLSLAQGGILIVLVFYIHVLRFKNRYLLE